MSELYLHWSQRLNQLDYPDGVALRAFRGRNNLSTAQASEIVGVKRRTWERYENGTLLISKANWLFLLLIANEVPDVKVLII